MYTDYMAKCEHGDDTIEFAEDTDNLARKRIDIHAAAIATAKAEMSCDFDLFAMVNGRQFKVFSNIK